MLLRYLARRRRMREAYEWLEQLTSPEPDRAAFAQWLARSADNARTFLHLVAIGQTLNERLPPKGTVSK